MSDRLPRGVALVLRRLLPADLGDPISGDLVEEYAAARRRLGPVRAAAWAWMQTLRLVVVFRWERVARGRALPPIGDELRVAGSMWDPLRQDIVFGVRLLWRQPSFTLVALVALALGIGANTAIFSVVDAVLWRPLPYAHADRVVSLGEQRPRESQFFGPIAPADFFDWRRDSRSFAALAAYRAMPPSGAYNMTGGGEPERVRPLEVTTSFFTAIGVVPALGRDFRAGEDTDGQDRVVLLSDGLWRSRFGADPSIVGRTVAFNGNTFEIVGVLPAAFWWPTRPDVVVPLALSDHDRTLRGAHFLEAVGRLRDGASMADAREELRIIGARLARAFPAENANHAPNLRSIRDAFVGDIRPALLVLLGAVGTVMLIACANVAMLVLARAVGRQKELALRRAIGATRARIVRQMLTESVIIALAGGGVGLLVATWSLGVLRAVMPTSFAGLPGIADVTIDARVLTAALVASLATGVLFGIVPALVSTDTRLSTTLNEESRGSAGGVRASRLRAALVVAELASSLVLLAGAAFLIVSFRNLLEVAPGFEPTRLTVARVALPWSRYGDHARTVAFFDALFDRMGGMPGVRSVAATSSLPFDGPDSRLDLEIDRPPIEFPFPVRAHPRLVSSGYFRTMGIRLVRGREFTERDAATSPRVVILNESAARRYWPGGDPIGRRVSLGAPDDWREVVGIVADTRHEGLDADVEPAAFLPQRQVFTSLGGAFERAMTIVVRADGDVAQVAAALRAAAAAIDSQVPIGSPRAMDDVIGDTMAPRRLNLWLVSAFAALALLLTAAGLYGVMAYLVAQRTHEIGVRMALGAYRASVLAMMLRQIGALTVAGLGIGVAGAVVLTRAAAGLLFGVTANDPAIYIGVSAILALVALAAVAVPSARATRIAPLQALRADN